jgi:hypothetical protein
MDNSEAKTFLRHLREIIKKKKASFKFHTCRDMTGVFQVKDAFFSDS